jgi:hypothetical protein
MWFFKGSRPSRQLQIGNSSVKHYSRALRQSFQKNARLHPAIKLLMPPRAQFSAMMPSASQGPTDINRGGKK